MTKTLLAAFAVLTLSSAMAPAQPPAGMERAEGVVAAVTDTSITLTKSDGSKATIALLLDRTVNITAPIAVDQIAPGSYVATANKSQPDGTGVSIELRVYPPGTPRFNVNRAMDQSGETMMTNGTVATAVSSNGGRVLTVDYGGGSRTITVPPSVTVVSNTVGSPAQVKVGVKLSIATFPAAGGNPARQTITIAKQDLAAQ